MDIRKALVLGGVMAAALAVPATGASASVAVFAPPVGPSHFGPPRNALTATTSLTNRPDGGGNGNWAIDTVTRTLTITETGHTGAVYDYTATVSDTGTFKTITGAFTPNQGGTNHGKKIKGTVQGTMTGTANYSFTASSLPSNARNLGVPTSESGTPVRPADHEPVVRAGLPGQHHVRRYRHRHLELDVPHGLVRQRLHPVRRPR